jgi:hypothetical protein
VKRLRRIIFNSLTALSLLLCVVCLGVAFGGESFPIAVSIGQRSPRSPFTRQYTYGGLIVTEAGQDHVGSIYTKLNSPVFAGLGILAAIPPLIWGWNAKRSPLRARRLESKLCPICNYDLRATPDRCPECGEIPAKAKV